MSERHCLKCKHCWIDPGCPGYSEYTPGHDSSMSCTKQHWRLEEHEYSRDDMRKAFESAATCRDYQEEA